MKHFSFPIILIFFSLIFSSCSEISLSDNKINPTPTPLSISAKYTDNVYYAKEEDYSMVNGYRDEITITVKNGHITNVIFNGYTDNGRSKKEESKLGGSYDMTSAGSKIPWHEQANNLENFLIETQDIDLIELDDSGYSDSVAGVSIKVDTFVELTNEALKNARK